VLPWWRSRTSVSLGRELHVWRDRRYDVGCEALGICRTRPARRAVSRSSGPDRSRYVYENRRTWRSRSTASDSATELEPGMRLDVPAAVIVRPPLAIPVGTRGQAADEPTDLGKRHRDGPGRGAKVTAEGLVFRLVFAPTSGRPLVGHDARPSVERATSNPASSGTPDGRGLGGCVGNALSRT
jgi:hypothetical protein